jgi:hypothetical protein
MKISNELQKLLKDRGIYVTEVCDRCSQILGPVRYTRAGDSGVWCSRKCRDGMRAHSPGTCRNCGTILAGLRHGAKYCSDVCRVRLSRKSSTSQNKTNQPLETKGLQVGLEVLAITPPCGP